MYKTILIVDNNTNNRSGIEIPDFDSNIEILPDLPNVETTKNVPAVAESVQPEDIEQPSTSNVMTICYVSIGVLLIILVALLIKSMKSSGRSKQDNYDEDNFENDEESYNSDSDDNDDEGAMSHTKKKLTDLATPHSISICIRKFLERTREN